MNLRKDQLYDIHNPTPKSTVVRHLSDRGTTCRGALRLGLRSLLTLFLNYFFLKEINITLQLLAMDVSAQATMKDAAKCDKRCEWQNSANQENVERILHLLVIPEGMSSSGLLAYHVANDAVVSAVSWYTFLCANDVRSRICTVGALISMAVFSH